MHARTQPAPDAPTRPASSSACLVTEEAFLQLPESVHQVELIDGEVIVAPAPTPLHQNIAGNLFHALKSWALSTDGFTVFHAPLDVRFGAGRILQPDLVVFDRKVDLHVKGPVEVLPILCVEVMSDRIYDRVTKRMIYGHAGVAEYWAIDPNGAFERWSGEQLGLSQFIKGELTSPHLPGFAMPVEALFK